MATCEGPQRSSTFDAVTDTGAEAKPVSLEYR